MWTDSSAALAAQWIDNCQLNHRCGTNGFYWLPSRLLDIGSHESPKLRLCRSESITVRQHYMTLSHCWGDTPLICLRNDNIHAMEDSIRFEDLPRTFQDAVWITRTFGVRYLWIDSLCIIQDSHTDWLQESSTMGLVYAFSLCTIAVSTAKDGNGGCLRTRNSSIIIPLLVSVPTPSYASKSMQDTTNDKENATTTQNRQPSSYYSVLLPPGQYVVSNADIWKREVEDTPLQTRGWVVQERFLSPRTLHFGEKQLFFECAELQACETFPKGTPGLLCNLSSQWKRRVSIGNCVPTTIKGESIDPWRLAWVLLVQTYSKGQLSRGEDKLVAFHGAATIMGSKLDSRYIAGLWESYLHEQLLWMVDIGYKNLQDPPSEYQAPSWSWASVNVPVKAIIAWGTFGVNPVYLAEVQSVVVHSGARISKVEAELQIHGRIFTAQPYDKEPELSRFAVDGTPMIGQMNYDHAGERGPILCMPFVVYGGKKSRNHVDGLLLEPSGTKEGQFKRVGMFDAWTPILWPLENLLEKMQSFESQGFTII